MTAALAAQTVLAAITPHEIVDWLLSVLRSVSGEVIGVLVGFLISWFLLIRKRRLALNRLLKGDSDDILFQTHHLHAVPGSNHFVLLFRNVCPNTKVDRLYDNPAANQIVREIADKTSLANPVLQTEGKLGFEILNDAFIHAAGHLASTPFEREPWLFAMTCEDRQIVRRRCIRCFLIRPQDLGRFADWAWCRDHVLCEKPWHWYRIVALHQIALQWKAEQGRTTAEARAPLVDEQATHSRVRELSVGVYSGEEPVGEPVTVAWSTHVPDLKRLGLTLDMTPAPAAQP
jgi:hypothetical protein